MAAILLAVAGPTAAPVFPTWYAPGLYPGITPEQSDVAHAAINRFYNGDFQGAIAVLDSLAPREERDSLPPLSQLLLVSMAETRLQRDEAQTRQDSLDLGDQIDNAAAAGLAACRNGEQARYPATCLLIEGGIRGFLATRQIPTDPMRALNEGLHALHLLQRALEKDSRLRDAYLGEGIFQCTVASAPLVVRAALKVMGVEVSMPRGMAALRRAAYRGQYTSVASQFFLIQFLSPFNDEPRSEKIRIFRTLESVFPESAYPTFLRWDEALCFYPDSFYQPERRAELEARLRAVVVRDGPGRVYRNLVKYQYSLCNPAPTPEFAPDPDTDLDEYSYYPIFLAALRLRRQLRDSAGPDSSRPVRLQRIRVLEDSALTTLENSGMNASQRNFFAWHIHDALREEMLRPPHRAD